MRDFWLYLSGAKEIASGCFPSSLVYLTKSTSYTRTPDQNRHVVEYFFLSMSTEKMF